MSNTTPTWNHNPLTPRHMHKGPGPRLGKTAKDHSTGAHASRFANQQARDAWLKESTGKMQYINFPGIGRH